MTAARHLPQSARALSPHGGKALALFCAVTIPPPGGFSANPVVRPRFTVVFPGRFKAIFPRFQGSLLCLPNKASLRSKQAFLAVQRRLPCSCPRLSCPRNCVPLRRRRFVPTTLTALRPKSNMLVFTALRFAKSHIPPLLHNLVLHLIEWLHNFVLQQSTRHTATGIRAFDTEGKSNHY